jgi:arylsulfatase A-like enzyme
VSRGARAAAVAAAVLAIAAAAAFLLPRRSRPHVVVLLWDTTRADRLEAYGYGRPTTPWLESVAAEGVLYEQCRAPSPWTLPSHASIFTGLLPAHHGASNLESPLAPSHRTLAERLREAGYDTILVSNNSLVHPATGVAQGFDSFRDVVRERGRHGADLALGILGEEMARRRADPARASRPLFLFVNLMEPHLPYDPPEEIERAWRPAGTTDAEAAEAKAFGFPGDVAHNLGIRRIDARALERLSALYDAEIRSLDGHSRAIEALLAREGVLGAGTDSLLVVASDHGENLGEHGLLDHKLSVSDALLRVPLVIRGRGRFEGGRRETAQVRLQDLFPTLLAAAGVDLDPAETPHARELGAAGAAGLPQVSEFAPPVSFLPKARELFPGTPEGAFEPFRLGMLAATAPEEGGRRLKWVRTVRRDADGSTAPAGESLFDLVADPGETRDLLAPGSRAPADVEAAGRLAALADGWTAPR